MGALFSTDAFAGRVVLVTGASRGIGKGIAQAFSRTGARVIGTATTEGGAQKITEALAGSGKGVIFDVTDATATDALIQSIVKDEGKICVTQFLGKLRRAIPDAKRKFKQCTSFNFSKQ